MKIAISYPPLDSPKGTPFLSQNRQFQWTNTGNVILPVIPAIGATKLASLHHQILWDDAISEKISFSSWLSRILKFKPDIVFFESKTPVIKNHWQIINLLKKKLPKTILVLMGDHPTALPEESLDNSQVDYVLTGGDYDFMMINLVDHLQNKTKLESGFYYRAHKKLVNTGKFALKHHNLDELPIIDRQLTNWQIYSQNNTNFKYKPGAYIMSARDCWWGKCTFCSWTTIYPFGSFRTNSVDHTISEIKNLVSLGIKEIFDDSGTLPTGKWLDDLCRQLIKTGLNKKVVLGCNMRFGALNQNQYHLMKQAGFRFLLFGLESANQKTLDLLQKNNQIAIIKQSLAMAKTTKLEPHVTIMVGYPWESKTETNNTLDFARQLFKENLVDSMQATIVIPYPGTPLFKQCQDNHWLLSSDWSDYDMRQPVMKSAYQPEELLKLVNDFFKTALTPQFLIKKIISIRSFSDIKHLLNYSIKFIQKLHDFTS